MNNLFNERELAFEARFRTTQDLKFKAQALSNVRFGKWLGARLGLSSEESEIYGHELADVRLNAMVREEMIKKIMADLAERNADVSEEEVRQELDKLYEEALMEVSRAGE